MAPEAGYWALDTMSSEDVETIRAGVAALNRGDVDGIAATLDPDVELVPLRAALDGSVYVGHEGLRRWMADMAEDWPHFKLALGEIRSCGPGRSWSRRPCTCGARAG